MEPDIGLTKKARGQAAEAMVQALADSYAVYQKTHLYHWNVQGPRFATLHLLFETQYNDLWASLDLMAERIRALGIMAPTHGELAKRAVVPSDNDPAPSEDAMLSGLLSANEALVKSCRTALKASEEAGDQASADLMTQRLATLEKAAWMLRAHQAS